MQVALNAKISPEVAIKLRAAAADLGRSQASILDEALQDWFKKQEKKAQKKQPGK